jgi:hypothetical protein
MKHPLVLLSKRQQYPNKCSLPKSQDSSFTYLTYQYHSSHQQNPSVDSIPVASHYKLFLPPLERKSITVSSFVRCEVASFLFFISCLLQQNIFTKNKKNNHEITKSGLIQNTPHLTNNHRNQKSD